MPAPYYLDLTGLEEAIDLLDKERSSVQRAFFYFTLNRQSSSPIFQIRLSLDNGMDLLNSLERDFHLHDWERLGTAMGRNTSVHYLTMDRFINHNEMTIGWDNDIGSNVFQCMEALYRGLELNTSLNHLVIDMDLFPCDGSLPTLNIQHEGQVRENLKLLGFESRRSISHNQSIMIGSILENTSLERCSVAKCTFGTAEAVFSRIILACYKMKRLIVKCDSLSQCDSVAALLRDPRSILSAIHISGDIDEQDYSPIAQALCDTSSIERVIASNHTIESEPNRNMPHYLQDYLALNTSPNKELVIRTKIARYYFRGEFDVSTIANMDVKCLPRLLAMIGGGERNCNAVPFRRIDMIQQQSAIFRILKCIPDLCNIMSSSDVRQIDENGARNGSLNKRQKVSK